MMVVEEIAEALTADFEAQMVCRQQQPNPWQRLDERDHPPGAGVRDRLL